MGGGGGICGFKIFSTCSVGISWKTPWGFLGENPQPGGGMEWKSTGKVSAAVVLGPAHATEDAETWEADTEDGHRVEAIRGGTGAAQRPFVLHVRAHSPEGEGGRARWPTLEEIQEAMNHTLPRGTVMAPSPWQSFGKAVELVPAIGHAGIVLFQVGAVEGSSAETRLKLSGGLLVTPGQGVPRG